MDFMIKHQRSAGTEGCEDILSFLVSQIGREVKDHLSLGVFPFINMLFMMGQHGEHTKEAYRASLPP